MDPMEYAIKGMESAVRNYSKDLEALSEEQILGSAAGSARKPVDFTYEVALLNLDAAARISGADRPTLPEGDDWWIAPDELQSKVAISAYMAKCCGELIGAARANGDKNVGLEGKVRPAYDLVNFCSMHTMYHCAQLNFIQSLSGDLAMHWF